MARSQPDGVSFGAGLREVVTRRYATLSADSGVLADPGRSPDELPICTGGTWAASGRGASVTILGLTFVLDTHLIDDASQGMARLWQLHDDRMIALARTDVLDTELAQIGDEEKRRRLMSLSAGLPEMLGILVADHSRWDHAVWGGEADAELWDRVWDVMSPGRNRATADRRHVRDAMNVCTAMRYGADALVTLDGSGRDKGMLDRAEVVAEAFDGFRLLTPDHAADFADRLRGGATTGSTDAPATTTQESPAEQSD
jgi:hypothetical protein